MSEQAERWALSLGGISSAEKLTLIIIAGEYDEKEKISSIPLSDLASLTCMSKRNLQRVIKSLTHKSLISYQANSKVVTNGNVRNFPFRNYELPLYEVTA